MKKIIVIGQTKTGTTSMYHQLLKLNYITKKPSTISSFEEVKKIINVNDAVVFGEIIFKYLKLLVEHFPNEKYIFLYRPMKEWIESYKRHIYYTISRKGYNRILHDNDYYEKIWKQKYNSALNIFKDSDFLIFDLIHGNVDKFNNFLQLSNDNYIKIFQNSKNSMKHLPAPKNTKTLENRFYKRINNLEKIDLRNKMVNSKCDLLIGHFGRLSNTCYPKHLLPAFDMLCKKYPNKKLKLLFCVKKIQFNLDIKTTNPNVIIDKNGIHHEDIHKFIQSCDLITSDYNSPSEDWAGFMHILESMACGVPVLCGNFDVRKEQLGNDYPFFWDKNGSNDLIIQKIFTILESILNKKVDTKCICEDLVERSATFTAEVIAKYIQ